MCLLKLVALGIVLLHCDPLTEETSCALWAIMVLQPTMQGLRQEPKQACSLVLVYRLPHVVASNISLLVPHLGGKAYPIKSAIVTAIGHLIQRAFGPTADGADAQGMPILAMQNPKQTEMN